MQGPILTMPSVFKANSAFPRSQSSSNITGLGSLEYKRPAVRKDQELPRSASFTSLSNVDSLDTADKIVPSISAEVLPVIPPETIHKSEEGEDGKTGNRLTKEERPKLDRVGRRKSLVARPRSWIQRVKGGSPERQETSEAANPPSSDIPPVPAISKLSRDKTKSVSESFATFARKSWITSSRSPSPSRDYGGDGDTDGAVDGISGNASTVSSSSPRRIMNVPQMEEPSPGKTSRSPSKRAFRGSTTLSRMKTRPQNVLMTFTNFNSANSSTSSLPRSSMDGKSTPRTSTDKVPPMPKNLSTEKLQSFGIDLPRKKDELLSQFKELANELSKFQSKSWSLKTNVVRSGLAIFLRTTATHPSNKNLRPEDLDRRINIFNKWWIAILEVLDGRQNQSVSGVDRPVLLEAAIGIMMRPEWRQSPSAFAPICDRSPNESTDALPLRSQKSIASLNSSASQFMAESIDHNVRNLYIQNLLSQMSYVVDKMSLRVTPPSLVTFCGKAIAYAFYFVPGVADILVRIWKLHAETLRRTADELGLPRRVLRTESGEITTFFPSHVRQFAWTSAKSMVTQLRKTPLLPLVASQIDWEGHWVSRWCGRDTDLFFVFAKHYHILAEEFLPSELSFVEKCRAPGFVLVQAQLLTTFEATIHRQAPAEPLPITFDDVLAGADASAAALPLPPSNNSARLMAENRLIMLLRDFISDRPSDYESARLTFAEAFSKMMQAGARKTSLFDHNACFILCDFMEEALIIFLRFHYSHDHESDFIDWRFWMEVCKKIVDSQNSMSEIRVFSLLYGAWNVMTNDERRKEVLCLEWLLVEETFEKFFNHWCPMVRAYYMRLLAWRMCREIEEASDLDTKIYTMVSTRIKLDWAHYLFLKQAADKANVLPPSTAPCHPAPGRRLLIIRNDTQSPVANLFLGFDGLTAPSTTQAASYTRHSSLPAMPKLGVADISDPKLTSDSPNTTPNKKRWTFMGKLIPSTFTASTDGAVSPAQRKTSPPTKSLEEVRRETALARSRPGLASKSSSADSDTPPATAGATHRAFSFKFSLEWAQHFEKSQNNSNGSAGNMGRGGPGSNVGYERRIIPPRLPAPAQAWLGARVPGTSREVAAKDPAEGGSSPERIARAKYAGRALAEWTLIVSECNNFVDRRRNEGVPGLKSVEVPTLGVEGFRKFGASG